MDAEDVELQDEAEEQGTTIVEQLRGCSLFEGLSTTQLERIVEIGEELSFRKNEHIFKEGDEGRTLAVILEGAVRIGRTVPGMGEEALTVLRPGAGGAFGEMVLVDDSPRSADALAHESCRLFSIDKEQLERLMFVDRSMALEILWRMVRLMAGRLRQTTDKITFLSISSKFE